VLLLAVGERELCEPSAAVNWVSDISVWSLDSVFGHQRSWRGGVGNLLFVKEGRMHERALIVL
jgi:hypothetical protein